MINVAQEVSSKMLKVSMESLRYGSRSCFNYTHFLQIMKLSSSLIRVTYFQQEELTWTYLTLELLLHL